MIMFFSLFLVSIIFPALFCNNSGVITVVETNVGYVRGYSNGMSWQFLGIPYAEPPINSLRWADPEPIRPWPGILDGANPPAGCPQDCKLPPGACPSSISEDCLYLNIYTPLSWNNYNSFKVMIFIHGGSFIAGSAGCVLYDGRFLANYSDTVIVTINYRLGALGFLYLDETTINGNLGIKDQRLAIEWVNSYIHNFGGDVSSITLFGQSAGAISIGAHLISPQSKGLFTSVIIQSNPWLIPFGTVEEASILGSEFLKVIDCEGSSIRISECLRDKTLVEIIDAQKSAEKVITPKRLGNLLSLLLQWGPIVDGFEIIDHPTKLIQNGMFMHIPIIMGTTSEEGLFFTDSILQKPVSIQEFELFLIVTFGVEKISSIKKLYSITNDKKDYRHIISLILGDYIFYCPTHTIAKSIANFYENQYGSLLNIWLYIWDHPASFQAWGPRYPFCQGHACHGIELPFIFSSISLIGFHFTTDEYSIVRQMQIYWSNMAKYSNPNDFLPRNWPQFNQTDYALIIPSSNISSVNGYRDSFCKFWESNEYLGFIHG